MTVSLGFVKRKKCLKEGKKMTVSFRTSSSRICRHKRQPTCIVSLFGCCSLVKINFYYFFETGWIVNFLPSHCKFVVCLEFVSQLGVSG